MAAAGGYAEGSGTQHPVDGRHLCASQLVELSQKGRAEQEPLKQGLPLEEEVKVASQFEQHLSRAVAEQQRQTQQEWDLRLSSRLSIEVERSSLLQGPPRGHSLDGRPHVLMISSWSSRREVYQVYQLT